MKRLHTSHLTVFLLGAVALISAGGQPIGVPVPITAHPRVVQAVHLLDVWLKAEIAYKRIPGMSVGVVYDQDLVWSDGFGYAHVADKVPATPGTLYKACSVVKPFTATAVMQLRDRGRLRLRDAVSDHLPWFEIESSPPNPGIISVEGLLTHTSGLPRDFPLPYWTGPAYPFPRVEHLHRHLSDVELAYPPGTQQQYSNIGMVLAGELVAEVSGIPIGEYLRQRIFDPLGMHDTFLDKPASSSEDRLATGYTVLQRNGTRTEVPSYEVGGLASAAGLISTVEDLGRFAAWQFRTLEGKDSTVLDPGTLRAMHQVQWMAPDAGWSRSGYGYQTWAENNRHFVGHAGACPGFESQVLIRPPEKFAAIVMTNSQGPEVGSYAQRIYDVMAPALRAATSSSNGQQNADTASPDVVDEFVGIYQRPFGSESAVLKWQDGLAVLALPADDPLRAIERYQHLAENVFTRAGTDGSAAADLLRFEEGPQGEMRMWRHHQFSIRTE